MSKKECVAMLLAGGQGSRLGALTKSIAKPAVSFGGKYRIIDFALSNCANSEINTVGVLTQYRPYVLHSYLGTGAAWDLDEAGGGISVLPPYATESGGAWYAGTADAIYQNIGYLETQDPEYVLILSGDHLYSMDYRKMIAEHKKNNADLTVSVMQVPWEEAPRFGILTADENGQISKFTEKPAEPDSNLASMGIYVFSCDVLVKALKEDAEDPDSEHDFGNNIIPKLLAEGKRLFVYEFEGFWKDVGTIASYMETNMQLLGAEPEFNLYSKTFPIMSNEPTRPPQFIGKGAVVDDSIVSNGCLVFGDVKHSVLSTDAIVGEHAVVEDSILLPGAVVEDRARVVNAILGEHARVLEGCAFGSKDEDTSVVGDNAVVGKGDE